MQIKNEICVVCGCAFNPRRGKLYCSAACKQTSYLAKNELRRQKQFDIDPNKHITLNFNEWIDFQELLEEQGLDENMSMLQFFYIRLLFDVPYERESMLQHIQAFFEAFSRSFDDKNSNLNTQIKLFGHMIENQQVKFISSDFSFKPIVVFRKE